MFEREREEVEEDVVGFNDIFENLKQNNLDPSVFETINDRDFLKASNFLDFVIAPSFLNTLILPKQVEIGTKLFCDYCPRCSKPGYLNTLFDQSIGNIKDNIMFLNNGICPKCKVTRYELIDKKELIFRNELVGVAGQRCISSDSLVYTKRGVIKLKNININDNLTHGFVSEKFESGLLPSLELKTKYNYTLLGAKDSHIVPVLKVKENKKYTDKTKWKAEFFIEDMHIKNCKIGDILLMKMPDLWPDEVYKIPPYFPKQNKIGTKREIFDFPVEVNTDVARLLGYLISNGTLLENRFEVTFSNKQEIKNNFIHCCKNIFKKEPSVKIETDTYISYCLNGIAISEWFFENIGLDKKARNKKIPECIMQSPKKIVCDFLSALFECDGTVYFNNSKKNVIIKYCSISKTLIKQIRVLLVNLGIITSCNTFQINGYGDIVYTENVEKGKEGYTISIDNSAIILRFISNIHFITSQKIDILKKLKSADKLRYDTPAGGFCIKTYNKWPISLKKVIDCNYFPIPIKEIKEGPLLEMMDICIPNTNMYTADGFVHHNSGKTKLVGLIAAYINHRFLKIPNPIRSFNQSSGDMLSGTFSALSLDHAYRNLWKAFKGFIDASPWFQNYHRFIREEEKRLGVELLHELKSSIMYAHKHLIWNATGSQDRKMRGDTRIFGAIDELGWMISDEQKTDLQNMNADAIYTALSNSLTTMRTKYKQVWNKNNFDLPPIIMANISSPSSVKDKIMRLAKEANKNDRILAVHGATWQWNPDYTYESLREEMSHIDDLTFDRDFSAEPPLASNPFLPEPRIIDKIAIGNTFDNFTVKEFQEKDFLGDSYKSAKLILKKGDRLIPRLIALDLGSMKNSLALCMFSMTPDIKPKLDFALAIKPDPTTKVRVNIAAFFDDFIVPLVNNFRIVHAFFDRWQSLDHIERLLSLKVKAQTYSLSYKEMDSVRGSILSQSVIIPKMEKSVETYVKEYVEGAYHSDSMALLSLQLLTVRDLGHKMAKPLLGDDDVFRAFCLGVSRLADTAVKREYLNSLMRTAAGHSVAHLGVVRSLREKGSSGQLNLIEGDSGRHIGSVRGRGANKRN